MRSLTWPQVAAIAVLVGGVVAAVALRSPEVALVAQLAQALLPSIMPPRGAP